MPAFTASGVWMFFEQPEHSISKAIAEGKKASLFIMSIITACTRLAYCGTLDPYDCSHSF